MPDDFQEWKRGGGAKPKPAPEPERPRGEALDFHSWKSGAVAEKPKREPMSDDEFDAKVKEHLRSTADTDPMSITGMAARDPKVQSVIDEGTKRGAKEMLGQTPASDEELIDLARRMGVGDNEAVSESTLKAVKERHGIKGSGTGSVDFAASPLGQQFAEDLDAEHRLDSIRKAYPNIAEKKDVEAARQGVDVLHAANWVVRALDASDLEGGGYSREKWLSMRMTREKADLAEEYREKVSDPKHAAELLEKLNALDEKFYQESKENLGWLNDISSFARSLSGGMMDLTDDMSNEDMGMLQRELSERGWLEKLRGAAATLIPALFNISKASGFMQQTAARMGVQAGRAKLMSNATAMGAFTASQGGTFSEGFTAGFFSPVIGAKLANATRNLGLPVQKAVWEAASTVAIGGSMHGFDPDEMMIDAIIGIVASGAQSRLSFMKEVREVQEAFRMGKAPAARARLGNLTSRIVAAMDDASASEAARRAESIFGPEAGAYDPAPELLRADAPGEAPVRPQEPSVAEAAPRAANGARAPGGPPVAPEAGAYREAPWPDVPGGPRARDYRSGQEYADAQMGWLRERAKTLDDPEQVRRIDRAMDEIQNQIDRGQAEDIWRDQRALELSATTVGAEQGAFEPAPEPVRAPEKPAEAPVEPAEPARSPDAAPETPTTRPEAPEVELGDEFVTGNRQAVINRERMARGKDPLFKAATRKWDTDVMDDALARRAENKQAGGDLVASLLEDPTRGVSDTDIAVLDLERVDLINRTKALQADINDARARGDDVAVVDLQKKLEATDLAFDFLDEAGFGAGSAAGRALNFQKALLNQRYEITTMRSRARAAKGGKALDRVEEARVAKLNADIEANQKALDEFHAKHGTLEERRAEGGAPKAKYGESNKFVTRKDVEAAKAAAIAALKSKTFSTPLPPKEVLDHLTKVGAYHVEAIGRKAIDLGKFTAEMVRDLGEEVRPYVKQVYEAALSHFDDRVVKAPIERRQSLLKAYKTRLRREMKSMKDQIDSGVKKEPEALELDDEAKALREDYQALRKDYRRIFGTKGITDEQRLSMAIKATERSLERWDKIIESGDPSPRPVKSKPLPDSAELDAVRAKRDAAKNTVMDLRKELRRKEREAKGRKGPSDEARLKAAIIATEKSIKDYEARLAKGDPSPPKRESRPLPDSKRLDEARARRDELRAQVDELRKALKPTPDPDAVSAKRWWSRMERLEAEYKRRVAEGDLEPAKRTERLLNERELQLRGRVDIARDAWKEDLVKLRLSQRNIFKKAGDFAYVQPSHFARAMQTAYDYSGLLRQGGFFALTRPVKAAMAAPAMFRAGFSREAAAMEMQRIRTNPRYNEAVRAGLFFSDFESSQINRMEEEFMGRWVEHIPGLGGSARAYSTILNRIRMDTFESLSATLSMTGAATAEESKAIAGLINAATGRALPNSGQTADWIANANTVLFAPRNMVSRFQMAFGVPLLKAPTMRTRKLIAKEYARYGAALATMYGLADLAGAEIETDPRSSDFGKIKFGNTRLDPTSGFTQAYRFLERMRTGKMKTVRGEVKEQTRGKMAWQFLRGKLAPTWSTAFNLDEKKNVVGDPVTPTSELVGLFLPLSLRDIEEAVREEGLLMGPVLGALSVLGLGVQNFDEDAEKPTQPEGMAGDASRVIDDLFGFDWSEWEKKSKKKKRRRVGGI